MSRHNPPPGEGWRAGSNGAGVDKSHPTAAKSQADGAGATPKP